MDIKIAVLTLVKGRTDALLNLIKGLARNSTPILELIIVHMNEDSCVLPVTPFPVRSLTLYSEEKLPRKHVTWRWHRLPPHIVYFLMWIVFLLKIS